MYLIKKVKYSATVNFNNFIKAQNMSNFNLGDVVVLKSGSDKMTIEEIDDDYISCVWMNKAGKQERGAFAAITLKCLSSYCNKSSFIRYIN